jgi:hypothetical protein
MSTIKKISRVGTTLQNLGEYKKTINWIVDKCGMKVWVEWAEHLSYA